MKEVVMAESYNPADHNVEEVKAYVEENPAEAKAVLEAEKARGEDARSTLVAHLEKVVEGQHDVPVPAEAPAVTVEPAQAPTQTFHGKEYEVTPEGGYRLKG